MQLYNVFTPNNDALNACWKVEGINPECEEAETKIFNRYGTKVYDSKIFGDCWNGRLNNTNANVQAGTYYYEVIIKRKDSEEKKELFGVITLINHE